MTFERIDAVQDVATTTGTGPWTMANAGVPSLSMRPFSVHTIGATFRYRAFAGSQWEIGTGTLTDATHIARSVRKSSNGDALVNFTTAPTVWEVIDAADAAAFLTAADAISLTDYLAANPGSTPTDADAVLFMQGSSLVAEPLGSASSAMNKRWVRELDEVIEVITTDAVTLDRTAHNRRRIDLYAVAPVKAPDLYASVGIGFRCNLKNFSGADVPLPGITVRSTGASVLPAGASAEVYTSRGSVFAELTGIAGAAATGGSTVTAPGQVTGLAAGIATDTTQPLTYAAPATGTAPFTYKIEYKRTADTAWTVAAPNATGTSYTVTGLTPSTSYDYRASAVNPAGTGAASTPVTKLTAAAAGAGGGGSTGGTAPFTAAARANFPTAAAPGATNYMWHDITPTGTATIATVHCAVSTSSTVAPTDTIGAATTPKGRWMGAMENYGGGTSWLIQNSEMIKVAGPATNYYFWIRVVDNTGATWWFCHTSATAPTPIYIGDGVANAVTSGTTPTPQVVGA